MAKDVLTAVRGSHPLSFEVADLLRRPGASMPLRFRASVGGLRLPLAQVPEGSELDFDLHVDSLVDGIHVRGAIRGEFDLQCARCLRSFRSPVEVEIDDLFTHEAGDDAFTIEGDTIDLEPASRDAMLLALPFKPVCREDCRGLCPTCGADRNEADCGHSQERTDIRWEALERLRDRLED